MQEYWFCDGCRSMNRASSSSCYRCRRPKAQAAFATVRERAPGVVLTPGLDEEHRQAAWVLMARHEYNSSWRLGYAAALLLGVAMIALIAGVCAIVVVGARLNGGDLLPFVDVGETQLRLFLAVVALIYLGAIVVHSVFLGLTDLNVPALGGGTPRFGALRSGFWWIESTLWAIRAYLGFVLPPVLCVYALLLGGFLVGILAIPFAVAWLYASLKLIGDPITCLTKPSRLLHDLYARLALPDSHDATIVNWWTLAWGISRGLVAAVVAMLWIAALVLFLAQIVVTVIALGNGETPPALIGDVAFDELPRIYAVFMVVEAAAELIAMGLLVEITLELSRRQRVREAWVLSGLDLGRAQTPESQAQ